MRVALLIAVLALASIAAAQVPEPPATDAEPIAALELPPRLNVPRDEATDDKSTAAALFAHARMLQQSRDFFGALRRYQRAHRYDERQRGLKEIVNLAMESGRFDQAARYAALGPEKLSDGLVLRRLAVDATNRRDWKSAARIYQALVQPADAAGAKSAPQVLMQAELGRLYFLIGEYEPASNAFAQVRAALAKSDDYDLNESLQKIILGERHETYALMARCSLEAKQYDDALALFGEAHRDSPESNQALRDEALVLERKDDAAGAEKLLSQALETGDWDAIEPLRRVLAKTAPADRVEPLLAKKLAPVQSEHADSEPLRRELARCLLRQEKHEEAQALLAAVADPADESLLLLAHVHRAQNATDKWLAGLATIAARNSLDAVEDEITSAAQSEALGKSVLEVARQAKVESAADRAAKNIAAHVALQRQEFEEASKLYEASLPVESAVKGKLLMAWGRKLTQADQYDRAIAAFQRILAEKLAGDELGAVYYYLSGAATLGGKFDLALEAAREGAKVRENDVRFQAREAWVLQHAKRYAEASEKYETLIKKFDRQTGPDVRSELRQARLVLSTICLELDDLPGAVERLEEVLDEFPEDIGAMNDLAYVWADRGLHLQRALQMVQRAVAGDPENRAYRDSLGWVFFRLGRFPEAVAELEKAAADKEPGGVILDHLGDALAKFGRIDDARNAWRKAAESFRNEGDEKAALAAEKKLSRE